MVIQLDSCPYKMSTDVNKAALSKFWHRNTTFWEAYVTHVNLKIIILGCCLRLRKGRFTSSVGSNVAMSECIERPTSTLLALVFLLLFFTIIQKLSLKKRWLRWREMTAGNERRKKDRLSNGGEVLKPGRRPWRGADVAWIVRTVVHRAASRRRQEQRGPCLHTSSFKKKMLCGCICMYVYIYMCVYIYIYTCVYVYIYICLYIYTLPFKSLWSLRNVLIFQRKALFFSMKITLNQSEIHSIHC